MQVSQQEKLYFREDSVLAFGTYALKKDVLMKER